MAALQATKRRPEKGRQLINWNYQLELELAHSPDVKHGVFDGYNFTLAATHPTQLGLVATGKSS